MSLLLKHQFGMLPMWATKCSKVVRKLPKVILIDSLWDPLSIFHVTKCKFVAYPGCVRAADVHKVLNCGTDMRS